MNVKTTSLAILLAACIALALGAVTAGPVHAQCGYGPNQEPLPCEKEKKPTRTELPPTATFTPIAEPTATPTSTPTATSTSTATPTLPSIPALAPGQADAASTGDWLPAIGAGLALILGLGALGFRLYANSRRPAGGGAGGEGKAAFSDQDFSGIEAPYRAPPRKNPSRTLRKGSDDQVVPAPQSGIPQALETADLHGTPPADRPGTLLDVAPDIVAPMPIPDLPEGMGGLALGEHDGAKDTLPTAGELIGTAEEGSAPSSDEDSPAFESHEYAKPVAEADQELPPAAEQSPPEEESTDTTDGDSSEDPET